MKAATSAVIAAVLAASGSAAAQDKAAAIRAFEEARELVTQGRYFEACPKFELSYRLDAATGTLLNLADCNERIGKTASAWAAFREAAERAHNQQRDDREREALRRATLLEPRLIRVVVESTDRTVAVSRDGVDISKLVGVEFPIDPGVHVFEATAVDRIGWRHRVELTGEGSRHTIAVPALEKAPPPVERAAPAGPIAAATRPVEHRVDRAPRRRRLILAGVIGGTGTLALGAAAALGVVAQNRWSDAERLGCIDGRCPTQQGFDEARRARSLAVTADLTAAVGAVAAIAGAVLWITAPDRRAIEIAPRVAADHIGVSARIALP